jgi:DNA mismatch endonuclease (patch repair protein)
MADILTPAERSAMMSRIRSRDTKPELIVRSMLHRLGYRFRLHSKVLPGHPDIVLPRYQTVILVHGCFWHHHPGCQYAYVPKSRKSFWLAKFDANHQRDRLTLRKLRSLGWTVLIVWECELRAPSALAARLTRLLKSPPS